MNQIYTSINKKNENAKNKVSKVDVDDYYLDVQTYTQTNDRA